MASLGLSENETESPFCRMFEQGWVDSTFGATVCVKPYGQEVFDEYMERTYAEEELLVLETAARLGKGKETGHVYWRELEKELPKLTHSLRDIVNELEDNKGFFIHEFDEGIKVGPKGYEFLEKRANRDTGFAVSYNQNINTGHGSPVVIGDGNTVITNASVNAEFDAAINALTELVRASTMPAEDIHEAIDDLAAINRLALQEKSEGIIARGIAKIGSLETLLKAAGLVSQIAPLLPPLLAPFQ